MTNRERCLDLLRRQEWVTTNDFLRAGCGSRFGARILELRKQGFEIVTEPVREGQARYRLVGADSSKVGQEASVAVCSGQPDPGGAALNTSVSSAGAAAPVDPPRLFEIPAPSRYEDAA